MKDVVPHDGETNTALFRRIVVERDVQAFFVVLPAGCRLLGLEKEFGVILEWLSNGWLASDQIFILAEAARWQGATQGSTGALSEPGNRTRYHNDFLAHDVHVRLWSDEAALIVQAISAFHEVRIANHWPWHAALHHSPPAD